MKKRKPLELGIDNFKKIINENYYYFDKTKMLKYFFDVRKRCKRD